MWSAYHTLRNTFCHHFFLVVSNYFIRYIWFSCKLLTTRQIKSSDPLFLSATPSTFFQMCPTQGWAGTNSMYFSPTEQTEHQKETWLLEKLLLHIFSHQEGGQTACTFKQETLQKEVRSHEKCASFSFIVSLNFQTKTQLLQLNSSGNSFMIKVKKTKKEYCAFIFSQFYIKQRKGGKTKPAVKWTLLSLSKWLVVSFIKVDLNLPFHHNYPISLTNSPFSQRHQL